MNEHQKSAFAGKIIPSLFNIVTNKMIAVLGFEKDTGDVRETPTITVATCCCRMTFRACVRLKSEENDDITEFKYHNMIVDEDRLIFSWTSEEAADGAHALVILTEWDEFKNYPYHEFYAQTLKPAFLFDGRGILNHRALEDIGFEVHAIGKDPGPDG